MTVFPRPRWFATWRATSALAIVCLAGLALASGCSGTASAGAEATGVVTLDGVPLPNALVSFYPTGGGSSAFSTTDSKGQFTVQTSRTESGLAPGEYRVTVTPGDDDSGAEGGRPAIPEKYQNDRTSDLTITVSEGAANQLKLELSSAE